MKHIADQLIPSLIPILILGAVVAPLAACAGPAEEAPAPGAAGAAGAPGPAGVSSPAPPPAPETIDLARTRPADGMVMVPVPAGELTMGDDASPFPAERPAHPVMLSDYWIDRTEVSNAQFRRCVEAGACAEPAKWSDANTNADAQPVLVPWESARVYCEWARARLPTEAEWERAARGTDGRLWPWGDEFDASRANLARDEDGYLHTAPVGSFPAGESPYGALDMAGNAAEWVADWYDEAYYARSPAIDPAGPGSGERRVYRSTIAHGGGGPEKCRTVARYAAPPRWEYGFRCAATEPPQPIEGAGG